MNLVKNKTRLPRTHTLGLCAMSIHFHSTYCFVCTACWRSKLAFKLGEKVVEYTLAQQEALSCKALNSMFFLLYKYTYVCMYVCTQTDRTKRVACCPYTHCFFTIKRYNLLSKTSLLIFYPSFRFFFFSSFYWCWHSSAALVAAFGCVRTYACTHTHACMHTHVITHTRTHEHTRTHSHILVTMHICIP